MRLELPYACREIAEIQRGVISRKQAIEYVHHVERPHGLPRAARQARITHEGRTWFLDLLYDNYGLCVELDGKEAHPDDQRLFHEYSSRSRD